MNQLEVEEEEHLKMRVGLGFKADLFRRAAMKLDLTKDVSFNQH